MKKWIAAFALICALTSCASGEELRILTYNVLASQERDEQRFPALFAIIEKSNADIVCLQEVESRFLGKLLSQPWFKANYTSPQRSGFDALTNGNYICVRKQHEVERVEMVSHDGRQGRKSLVVHLLVKGQPLAVATCHLESPLQAGSVRASQLDDIFTRLKSTRDAIVAGDFNFGDGEQPDTAHLDPDFQDVWTTLRASQPGYTWDVQASPMAKRGSFVGERSRRLDRILVRSKTWRPKSVHIVGDQPLVAGEDALFPSDHFGLVGVLAQR